MPENAEFIPVSMPSVGDRERDYLLRAVESGWISSLGEYVTRFEEEFAAFCGAREAVSVSNGTAALHLALHALGIRAGDEVLVPDLSFIASANAILMSGATPVFCDIDPETLCVDVASAESMITPRTKAIMPVHLYGHPADMTAVMALAERHGLVVVEDCAEAHGSEIEGQRVGSFGECGTFSFYANKNMTTGEGGMITTNSEQLADDLRELRDHAMSKTKRYWHERMGFNYRMTNLQAAVGCAQMESLPRFLAERRRVFARYQANLADDSRVRLNREAPGTKHSYWMICAEISGVSEATRDQICRE
ncbi:DegT/DnrJ/EryC1/StrS family aminotransferase, partial [bacterium]|nr:DegT/DnrJ/EryC1/StrS family aminotransferase [bacterium]